MTVVMGQTRTIRNVTASGGVAQSLSMPRGPRAHARPTRH
jgi:hypothetical protein